MIGRTPLPEPQIVENQPYPGIGYDDLRRAYEGRRRRRQERQQQQQQQQRRSRSRLSDFIYPMRAPSNMAYHSPPPTIYPMRAPSNMAYHSPPPSYEDATGQLNNRSLDALAANLEDARRHDGTQRDERTDMTEEQLIESFRPMVRSRIIDQFRTLGIYMYVTDFDKRNIYDNTHEVNKNNLIHELSVLT